MGVTIPKDTAKKLGLRAGDKVELKTDLGSRSVVYSPAGIDSEVEREKVSKLTSSFVNKYRKDLEALADK